MAGGEAVRAVVTGAAGFMGSLLCDRLLADGHEVVGIDCLTPHYSPALKERNLAAARQSRHFAFRRLDLAVDDLRWALVGAEWIFHFAGRSGVGVAGAAEFGDYVHDNVVATQRLLEAVVNLPIKRFVFAGSSSIYGAAERLPTKESAMPRPLSTYGVTKLAAEGLVHNYAQTFDLPATVLRFFTIYGPRQRPDMAVSRFIEALAAGEDIDVHGDGEQTRDFTYVDDAIEATVLCARAVGGLPVLNIGGGSRSTINGLLGVLQEVSGQTVRRHFQPRNAPPERHAAASINLARQSLGWEPRISLREGLARQWRWAAADSRREPEPRLTAAAV